jgi:hypothetical protein
MLNRRQQQMLRSLFGVAMRGLRANRPHVGIAPDMLLELIQLASGESRRADQLNRDLAARVKEAEERLEQLGIGLDELANDPALPLFYKPPCKRRTPRRSAGTRQLWPR